MNENNAKFWDDYVTQWLNNPQNKQYTYLGNNWKGETVFLNLLKKYCTKGQTTFEIGCGGGRITAFVAPLVKNVIATDISAEMIKKSSSDLTKFSNIEFRQNDGFSFDFIKNDSIHLVYSHDVFVHFSSLQGYAYLNHIKRILKPKGIGIVSFNNFITHFEKFKWQALKFNNEKILPPSMRHHFMTAEMLEFMLKDLGYKILEIDTTNFLIGVFQKIK